MAELLAILKITKQSLNRVLNDLLAAEFVEQVVATFAAAWAQGEALTFRTALDSALVQHRVDRA